MDETLVKAMDAVDALRNSVDKYGQDSADTKEMLNKVEETLAAQEKASQKTAVELREAKTRQEELKEQVGNLELSIARGAGAAKGLNYKDGVAYKALTHYFKHGDLHVDDPDIAEELKTLRTDSATGGGYRTAPEMDPAIIKKIIEIDPWRAFARVKTVSSKVLSMVVRKTIPEAFYEGEAAEGQDDEGTYGAEEAKAHRLTVTTGLTRDQIMDDLFDIESEISADVGEAFGKKEGLKFINGDGVKKPEGVLFNEDVLALAFTTAGSGVVTADDLMLATGELKAGYDPLFTFNRRTLAKLRTLKDGAGAYVWQLTLIPGTPNSILGEPYAVMPSMPDIAAGAIPILYGDIRRGYTIIDRTGMTVIRDEVTKKRQAIVEFTYARWNDGQVTLPEAFVPVKIKA
jgi:HK97 family phage major capsid protein